jgi:hypothetical protein
MPSSEIAQEFDSIEDTIQAFSKPVKSPILTASSKISYSQTPLPLQEPPD